MSEETGIVTPYSPCANCGHQQAEHMPDGACLFEPTMFKAAPVAVWTMEYTGEWPEKNPPEEKLKFKEKRLDRATQRNLIRGHTVKRGLRNY